MKGYFSLYLTINCDNVEIAWTVGGLGKKQT